jgi:hypothetical protein
MELLSQLNGGRVIRDLAEKYPQVIEAVRKTGKKGELSLRLVIRPDGKGEVQTVDVLDEIKTKLPERDKKATTFFVSEENLLSRLDPNQREMEFEAPGVAAAKEVAVAGGR